MTALVLAIVWSLWAALGLVSGHVFILLGRTALVHLKGWGAISFSAGLLPACVALLLPWFDHWDRRDNETSYARLKRCCWILAGVAMVAGVVLPDLPPPRWTGALEIHEVRRSVGRVVHALLTPASLETLFMRALWLGGPSMLVALLGQRLWRLDESDHPVARAVKALLCLAMTPAFWFFGHGLLVMTYREAELRASTSLEGLVFGLSMVLLSWGLALVMGVGALLHVARSLGLLEYVRLPGVGPLSRRDSLGM
ncbi:hypothetical protein ACQ859_15440 [Roseateles chitinivorans]|uniref:hypothetical protein n=1 Tax=Roseateles chitinivorans TaxID=2917965 RepID=UPI003D66ACA2